MTHRLNFETTDLGLTDMETSYVIIESQSSEASSLSPLLIAVPLLIAKNYKMRWYK